jgi:DNA-directed RNA polymerase subunit RPC12/RpoP
MNPVQKILGKGIKVDISKSRKIKCFNCGKEIEAEDSYYWYAGDQDNLVCETCAKKLEHHETVYSGMNVFKTGLKNR